MLTFIKSEESLIEVELEIMNSQPSYNLISSGRATLTTYDIIKEQKEEKLEKERYVIKWMDHYVGIIDFTLKNPKDGFPWLGLFLIHSDWENRGIAKKAYSLYESMMVAKKVNTIRLGCFEENKKGKRYWEKLGFDVQKSVFYKEKPLLIMQKKLS
ncbi:GNAT family N-acetyltransferase [Sutcliffiella rhizosphaerae]|uniref:N-acetyltransferase domain-containing protein n=1 Tax=Sutcliffiella rhizosphaerae TaxID=2880967 RepID=A0ABM8YJ37_9BACI|nr:GNAT family N-acetyltransferase [Sutcliffiella rhizosphaerae]CAG9619935.1 hypothetical protein BACCIP111883_00703 [Sutcliffiella rhizosphaerae]